MSNRYIYVITVFEKMETEFLGDSDFEVANIGCKVINGWYSDKETAESIVINNSTDICESCYKFAVIEKCSEGMYDFGRERTYYKYNQSKNTYEKMSLDEIPSLFNEITFSVSGIGM